MKRNNVDAWCKIPVETIEIDGVKVTISGLTVSQLDVLTSVKRSNIDQSIALICACCDLEGGAQIDLEKAKKFRADVFKTLSDAVARVNGLVPQGNLSATAGEDSFSV
jgi:hypothetical protein